VTSNANPDAGDGVLPVCVWPDSLATMDASAGACRNASRFFLSCQASGGGTESCLSNDPTRCPGDTLDASGCRDQCQEDEYAIVCGSIGPSSNGASPTPAGCGPPFITPAGIAFYCCPCGR
jgi:hypothetical protein